MIAAELTFKNVRERKRVLFLVPSIPLVEQQALAIEEWLLQQCNFFKFRVARFHGGKTLPNAFHVLVATPEAFRMAQIKQNCLDTDDIGSLEWFSFGLIIFDEVHHVLKDHPYRKLAIALKKARVRESSLALPDVLGLTASVTYAVGKDNIEKTVQQLCTDLELDHICQARPHELQADGYHGSHGPAIVALTEQPLQALVVPYKDRQPHLMKATFHHRISRGDATPFATCVSAVVAGLENLVRGLIPNWKAPQYTQAVSKWAKMAYDMAQSKNGPVADVLFELSTWYSALKLLVVSWEEADYAANILLRMYRINDLYSGSRPRHSLALTKQVQWLFASFPPTHTRWLTLEECLCAEYKRTNGKFRGIIFVQQKITTHLVQFVVQTRPRLRSLFKPTLVYAANSPAAPGLKLTRAAQDAALDRFRTGHCNLLISTNTLEEGMDVPAANCVLRFDRMQTSTSLVQSRGRARQSDSSFFVLDQRPDRTCHDLAAAVKQQRDVCENLKLVPQTASQRTTDLEEARNKQWCRENTALNKLRSHLLSCGPVHEQNGMKLLHEFCQRSKIELVEANSGGNYTLMFASELREVKVAVKSHCRTKRERKDAKRKAAVKMINQLMFGK